SPRGTLHPFGRLDADQVEAARDHVLRRTNEYEAELALLALEHAMLVVEAVEVVGHADRVVRERLRRAPLGRIGDERGKLQQPLDQLALLARQRLNGRR